MRYREVALGDIADVQWGDTATTKAKYVKEGGYKAFSASGNDGNLPYFDFNREGVILSAIGAACGKFWYTSGKWSSIKNTIHFWSKDEDIVLTKFLAYAINPKKWIISGSAQPFITLKSARDYKLNLPDLETQKKVVRILSALDNKIEINNLINSNLIEQCKSIYKKWFIDYDFTIDGKMTKKENSLIPEGWSFKRIDELDLDISDGNYSSKYPTKREFKTKGIPFIRGTDFDGYSISRKNLMYIAPEKHEILKKGHLKKNDILITTRGEIGRIAFVSDCFIDSNINAQLIRINGDERYPRSFLGMSLIASYVQKDIQSLVTGTALKQLPIGKFNQVKIIIPGDNGIIQEFDSIVENMLKKNTSK